MKILQMPAYFLPCKGGIEYAVYYLSKGLIKLGNEVKVITSKIGYGKSRSRIDNIKVRRTSAFTFLKSPISLTLLPRLFKEKPDVIHLHYPHPFFIDIGAFFARLRGIPYVVHSHGNEISLPGWKNIFAKIYNMIFFNHALNHANAIITNTSKVIPQSKYFKKYKDKIYTIPHGIDLDRFTKKETELKSQLGLDDCKIIMFTGALRQYKGLNYLIDAMKSVVEKVPEARLIIIGKGDMEKELYALVKKLKLEKYVMFQGFIDQEKLLEFYSIADLFVLPSPTIEESFGMVAFEACAMEVPAIVTNGCGVSEIFEREKIDTIVEPRNPEAIASKCIILLNNDKLRKHIGKFARKKMEFYSWDIITKQYQEVYDKVIKWKQ